MSGTPNAPTPPPKLLLQFKVEPVLCPVSPGCLLPLEQSMQRKPCVKAHSFQRRKGPTELNCFRLGRRERERCVCVGGETIEPGLTFLWRRKNVGKSVNVYPPGPTHMNRKTEQLTGYLPQHKRRLPPSTSFLFLAFLTEIHS